MNDFTWETVPNFSHTRSKIICSSILKLSHSCSLFTLFLSFFLKKFDWIAQFLTHHCMYAHRYFCGEVFAYFSFCKCCGKLNMVGTASRRSRTVCPVLSKHASSKWALHRQLHECGVNLSLFMRTTQSLTSSGLDNGNLWNVTSDFWPFLLLFVQPKAEQTDIVYLIYLFLPNLWQ